VKNRAIATKTSMFAEPPTKKSLIIIQRKKLKAGKWIDYMVCRDSMDAMQIMDQIYHNGHPELHNYHVRLISRHTVEQPLDIYTDDVRSHAAMLGIPENCNGR